jgi:hypothetical protein
MIGEVALFGLFTLMAIQDALQNKIDDYLSGCLWLLYIFLFPGANLHWAVITFGLLVVICRYAAYEPKLGFIMGWGDVLAIPILLDWVISAVGYSNGIVWLIISGILTLVVTKGIKQAKVPFLPMMWLAWVIMWLAFVLF